MYRRKTTNKDKKNKVLHVRISEEAYEDLQFLKSWTNATASDIIRELINENYHKMMRNFGGVDK